MDQIKLNKQLNEIYEHFEIIFDQFMDLYVKWVDRGIPKSVIMRTMACIVIDLFYDQFGKEATHQHFYSMIESHEDSNNKDGLESNIFYN